MSNRIARNIEILMHELHDLEVSIESGSDEDINKSLYDCQLSLNHVKELIKDDQ